MNERLKKKKRVKALETGQGATFFDLSRRTEGTIVFCRICIAPNAPVSTIPPQHKVLHDLFKSAKTRYSLKSSDIRTSVYGGFLVCDNGADAVEAAESIMDKAAGKGVALAIGIAAGPIKPFDDFGIANLIGVPINYAARLAAMTKKPGKCEFESRLKIAVTLDVVLEAVDTDHQFSELFDSNSKSATVKKSKLAFKFFNSNPKFRQRDFPALRRESKRCHVVVYDIAGYSMQAMSLT